MGFPAEQHDVPTQDGYLLSCQRIPRLGSPAVVLQHGVLDSSTTWILNQREQSLGFMLADAGYDVWLTNSRGNRYSNSMADGSDFDWRTNMDDMIQYDNMAILQYVTGQTNQANVTWIGHSRGTEIMFMGLAAYPEQAQYVNQFIALAPIAWIGNVKSLLLQTLAPLDTSDLFSKIGYKDFLSSAYDLEDVCVFLPFLCDDLITSIAGPGLKDPSRFNQSMIETYLHHFPAGTPSEAMAEYAQIVEHDDLSYYDYGTSGNENKYGSSNPPAYDLTQIPSSVPISAFYGTDDYLADMTDVNRLISTLGKDRFDYLYQINGYSHLDFVWGLTAQNLIYPKVLQILNNTANGLKK
jgi:pimeloyl-ACP methyl ester carboxylesterase